MSRFAPKSLVGLGFFLCALPLLVQCGSAKRDLNAYSEGGAAGALTGASSGASHSAGATGLGSAGKAGAASGGSANGGAPPSDGDAGDPGNGGEAGTAGPIATCPAPERECAGACIAEAACCGNSECASGKSCVSNSCACNEGTKLCNGACIASSTCCSDTDCPTGGSCASGTCSCPADTHQCDSACVSNSTVDHCGAACTPCTAPTGGTATCDGTTCGATCPTGQKLCAGSCIANNAACTGMCPGGTHDCSGLCVADSDVTLCGPTCANCAVPANSDANCTGSCGFDCKTGFKLCNGACIANSACCQNTDCQSGATCSSGSCTCNSGSKLCNGACIANSACCQNTDCQANAVCSTSHVCGCSSGYKACGSSCIANTACCTTQDCTSAVPIPVCTDSNTLQTSSGGSCGSGTCSYTHTNKTCASGCLNGACQVLHPTQITVGLLHMCVLMSNGHVWCWGRDGLGNGSDDSTGTATPTEVQGITTAVQIAAGGGTTCAVLSDKTLKCWGDDSFGVVGANGTTSSPGYFSPAPGSVGGLSGVNEVFVNSWNACAVLSNGIVRCWGSDPGGGNPISPKTISSLTGVAHIGSDNNINCAALSDKSAVKCWQSPAGAATAQAGLPANVIQVAGHCALSSDGSVRCWGTGGQGQIGNGQTVDQSTPQLVQQLGKATAIVSGDDHVCAILSDQSFWCWGKDGFFDPIDYGPYPLAVSGVNKVVAAAAHYSNTCVIETDNTVKCWGSNLSGYQLGTNGPSGNGLTPVVITGLPTGS